MNKVFTCKLTDPSNFLPELANVVVTLR